MTSTARPIGDALEDPTEGEKGHDKAHDRDT